MTVDEVAGSSFEVMVNAPADLFPGAMVACELQRNPSTRRLLTEPVVNVLYQVACVGVSVGIILALPPNFLRKQ